MKKVLLPFAAFAMCACGREIVLTPRDAEVVVAPRAAASVRFAGGEMTNYLSRVLGAAVPLADRPTEGRASIVLGANAWSKAEGIDADGLETDAFVVKATANRVYIVGRDDARLDIGRILRAGGYGDLLGYDRATLHGVYDFLERVAGVRFYLPDDELGVIVPRSDRLSIPEGTRTVVPDYLLRDPYFAGDGQWHVASCDGMNPKTAHWLRLRLASTSIPCCHGSRDFKYIERFGKTHPEYLALKKDGSRWTDPKSHFAPYQYCWTNPGFREELYQDVKAYLTGQPASSRGLKGWGPNCRHGKWVDIMPDDSFQGCWCEGCRSAYTKGADGTRYASELIWGVTAEIGNRLLSERVPGNVTMMAYSPYRAVPDFALPSNVWVMVAVGGPWSLADPKAAQGQYDEIRAWRRKLGHKIWVWTYPSKYGELMIPGVPCVGPHAWGKFYADLKDDILGGFCECESDRSIYNFLNYYVYSRVMWDAGTDIDSVLGELYSDLFGAGKDEMERFFSLLEDRWTKRVVGNLIDTSVGPRISPPLNAVLWGDIYSPALRSELDALLRAATVKVGAASVEGRRIALMRTEFYDRMCAGAMAHEAERRSIESLRFDPSKGAVRLTACASGLRWFTNVATVATSVTARRTDKALTFAFTCEDPKISLASEAHTKSGDRNSWQDNTVEVILNPSGDGKTIFHYILTSGGNLAGQRYERGVDGSDWKGYLAGVRTSVKKGSAGWTGTIEVPIATMGDVKDAFPINFCRHRMLTDGTAESISWSPYVMQFHDIERFGMIDFKD